MPDLSSLTFLCRTNTLCLDVNGVYPGGRCPRKDWVMFLKKDLGLKAQDLVETQVHSITNYLMVNLKTEEQFTSCLDRLRKGVLWTQIKQPVYGWSTQEVLITVRIINLSCHIDIDKVKKKMNEYGQIAWSKLGYHQDLPGVRDGTLTLRMKMNEDATLPSFLDLGNMGECLQIFSDVSEKVCFKCSKPGHISAFCRAKPKTVSQETSSWARIVDGKLPSNPPTTIPAVEAVAVTDDGVPDPGSASNGDALSSQTARSSTPSNVRLALTSPRQVTGNKPSSSTTGVDMPDLAAGSSTLSSVRHALASLSQGTENSSIEDNLPLGQGREESASLQRTDSFSLNSSMENSGDVPLGQAGQERPRTQSFSSPGNTPESLQLVLSSSSSFNSKVRGVSSLPGSPWSKGKKRFGTSPDPDLLRTLSAKKNNVMSHL